MKGRGGRRSSVCFQPYVTGVEGEFCHPGQGIFLGLLSNQGEKRYKLLFQKGSFKKTSI